MKKFIMMMLLFMGTMFTATAQVAIEKAKVLDNTYVSVGVGAATPLSFDNVFPLNTTTTVAIGKWFTPVIGTEVESTLWYGSHYGHYRFDGLDHLKVRGSYLGINTLVNLNNAICGYKGTPRLFEVSTVVGLGWTRALIKNADDNNGLGFKTGLDLGFNLGAKKAHSIGIRPAVLWEVTHHIGTGCPDHRSLTLTKNHAQLQLAVAYTYHFKTSNGTHNFRTYDIGALNDEINALREAANRVPDTVYVEKVVIKEVPVESTANTLTRRIEGNTLYVFFAQNSSVLTDAAKQVLDKVSGEVTVSGYASPEGSPRRNQVLSQERADVVSAYLRERGVNVVESVGRGVNGETSNRVAEVVEK